MPRMPTLSTPPSPLPFSSMPEPAPLRPGLVILQGNRLELLAEAVFAWLAGNPLGPLEQETFLVQSNGMGEWLKMEIAAAQGICAATRVELPARFVWRAYRAVLGRTAVPAVSALDKLPLTWRLMGLLPRLALEPGFEPVRGFLAGRTSADEVAPGRTDGDPTRRLQLAQRLADLFDQYQVYRSDWLTDWAAGRDVLRTAAMPALTLAQARAVPVPAEQCWQPALWRAVLAGLTVAEQTAIRPALHRRFVEALAAGGRWPQLPRRIVVFGSTHIPHQTLEAIVAVSAHCQVLMAVPNPCRYHWADTLDGRELLGAAQRRQALRGGRDLANVPLQDMHAHGHPLLSAWGRQARDFVRLLDAFDAADGAGMPDPSGLPGLYDKARRVDLFDDAPGGSWLSQVQARIRDLVPLAEHRDLAGPARADFPVDTAASAPPTVSATVPASDRSIVFHVAHSAQREVEILHDQLLHLLAHPPASGSANRPLSPRDVVVMVPQIDAFTPAIRAVFGQYARSDPRHIPWGIADRQARGHHPLLVAVEWLLGAVQHRFAFSEMRDLLDVPAVAKRMGVAADDLPTLVAWLEGAGIRWGLHAEQRERLGLAACGDANTWRFGLDRLLLGYATGDLDGGFVGIEPYAEVGGLAAGLAGILAELLDALGAWWRDAASARSPQAWGERLRALLAALFAPVDDDERTLLAALDDALTAWLQACETAGFGDAVELAVVREAWLSAVDEPGLARRFRAGGVTFCTLLPMRAIPFEVVCLLGMNDGDYPRRGSRSDFDLMALGGQARPGDRSRRDDDRQLMLDALLAARRVLYISWAGRSPRDNQPQPPSVLVAQLRDYLAAGWGADALHARTVEHPLQPFSRKYFEPKRGLDDGLLTYASEWRAAHRDADATGLPRDATSAVDSKSARAVGPADDMPTALTLAALGRFLRNPVKAFFRHRLQVSFDEVDLSASDDEPFTEAGLDRWQWLDEAVQGVRAQVDNPDRQCEPAALASIVERQVGRLKRAGRLPLAGPGARVEAELVATLLPMVRAWQALGALHPRVHQNLPLQLAHPEAPGVVLDDWLVGLRSSAAADTPSMWIELQAGKLAGKKAHKGRDEKADDQQAGSPLSGAVRADKLVGAWLRCLASAAVGQPARGAVIAADAIVHVTPPPREAALSTLQALMQACHDGTRGDAPLPTAVLTGLAFLDGAGRERGVFEGGESGRGGLPGEGDEPCLARLYPTYAVLHADPNFAPATRQLYAPFREWLAQHVSVEALPDAVLPEEPDGA